MQSVGVEVNVRQCYSVTVALDTAEGPLVLPSAQQCGGINRCAERVCTSFDAGVAKSV